MAGPITTSIFRVTAVTTRSSCTVDAVWARSVATSAVVTAAIRSATPSRWTNKARSYIAATSESSGESVDPPVAVRTVKLRSLQAVPEALAPRRVAQPPAELALGLGVGE